MFRITARYFWVSLLVAIWSASAWADARPQQTVLGDLQQVLLAKDAQMGKTPDGTVFVRGNKMEATFGVDGKVRVHNEGTIGRMEAITQGMNVNLGEALGHRKKTDASLPQLIGKLLDKGHFTADMRSNGIGFQSKRYTTANRPMDLKGNGFKAVVKPNGAIKITQVVRGPLGFTAPAKATTAPTIAVKPAGKSVQTRTRTRTPNKRTNRRAVRRRLAR